MSDVYIDHYSLEEYIQNKPPKPAPPADPRDGRAVSELLHALPPAGGLWAIPPVQEYVGVYSAGQRFYKNPSEAIRHSRENARNMLRSLEIVEPLQARRLAVAELSSQVEPEDKSDKEQLWVASEIQKIIEECPNFMKLKSALLWATWYGKYGVQIKYEWDWARGYKRLVPKDWSAVHGDSIYDKFDSDRVGILVGTATAGFPGLTSLSTQTTDVARAHVLTQEDDQDDPSMHWLNTGYGGMPNERDAFIIHRHELLAGDFFEIEKAGGVKGVGIREFVYWVWYIAQEVRGWLIEFLERVGTGLTIYRYLRGDQESYNAVKQIAESQSFQNVLLFPIDANAPGMATEGIERIEPSPVAIDNMLKVISDYFGNQIKTFIVGQSLTSESHATGLGSGVADAHEHTFARLIHWDALCLAETLTSELVRVIQKYTFPWARFKCKFVISKDDPDPQKVLEAVKTAYDMGVSFDEDEVRSLTGLTKPHIDAVVIKKTEAQPQSGMGLPPGPGEQGPEVPLDEAAGKEEE